MSTYILTLPADFDLRGITPLPDTDVEVTEDYLYVEDDMGSQTNIKTVRSDTLLGIRRAVREMNPGRIAIDSPYDCTGRKCFQSCKLLKVYKTYSEGFVAVIELRMGFDV